MKDPLLLAVLETLNRNNCAEIENTVSDNRINDIIQEITKTLAITVKCRQDGSVRISKAC